MSDFIENDVVGELHDLLDAYVVVDRCEADRSRMMGEVCQECDEEIEEILDDGYEVVADGLGDDWSKCYCFGCWSNWAATEAEFKPLFQPAGARAEHWSAGGDNFRLTCTRVSDFVPPLHCFAKRSAPI